MNIEHAVTVDAPLDRAWPLITDVFVVAACLPGASLEAGEDDVYRGTLAVAFGPTTATFSGRAGFTVDEPAKQVVIDARGSDQGGRTRAAARVTVLATAPEAAHTRLELRGNIDVIGPLAAFAQTGGAHLAGELMQAFAGCLASRIGGESPAATAPQAPIRPLTLWWRALLRWLRRRFVRTDRRK